MLQTINLLKCLLTWSFLPLYSHSLTGHFTCLLGSNRDFFLPPSEPLLLMFRFFVTSYLTLWFEFWKEWIKIKSFYFSAIHLLEPHMKRKVNADRHLFFCLCMQLRDVTKTNRTLAKLKGFFVCLLFMIWVWKNENIR